MSSMKTEPAGVNGAGAKKNGKPANHDADTVLEPTLESGEVSIATADNGAALVGVYGLILWCADKFAPREHVEDVAHDAAIAFLLGFDASRPSSNPRHYAQLVVRRAAQGYKNRAATEYRKLQQYAAMLATTTVVRECAEPLGDDELQQLRAAVESLTPIRRKLLTARFGLDGQGPKTLRELGGMFGVTVEALRQRAQRCVRDVRNALAEEAKS